MINKKAVVVLVIVAFVIAGFSIIYSMVDSGREVTTTNNFVQNINTRDNENGMVGVKVNLPTVEDKDEKG